MGWWTTSLPHRVKDDKGPADPGSWCEVLKISRALLAIPCFRLLSNPWLRNIRRLTSCSVKVTAIDIYPAELPDEQPDNLDFEVWNLNDPLVPTYRSNHYDLIHSRLVAPGIKKTRWRSYIRDLARLLKRGGWVQVVEFYYIIQSDSGMLTDEHALQRWGTAYRAAMEQERDPRIGRNIRDLLRDAGLVDVNERSYRMPIGDWPDGKTAEDPKHDSPCYRKPMHCTVHRLSAVPVFLRLQ